MAHDIKQPREKKASPRQTVLLSVNHLVLILNLLPVTGLKGSAFGIGGAVCFIRSTMVDRYG
jgi:hypothetical protein